MAMMAARIAFAGLTSTLAAGEPLAIGSEFSGSHRFDRLRWGSRPVDAAPAGADPAGLGGRPTLARPLAVHEPRRAGAARLALAPHHGARACRPSPGGR